MAKDGLFDREESEENDSDWDPDEELSETELKALREDENWEF